MFVFLGSVLWADVYSITPTVDSLNPTSFNKIIKVNVDLAA